MSSDRVDQNHFSFIQQFYNRMPLPSYIKHREKELFPLLTSFELFDHGWREYVIAAYNIRQLSNPHSTALPDVVVHLSLHEDDYSYTYSFFLPSFQVDQGEQDGELIFPVIPIENVTISIDTM